MDKKLLLYSVSDQYIRYLRLDPKLRIVFDNKENARSHTRKYLGVVIRQNGYNYFVPFSSPKDSDYIVAATGSREIRPSIIPIIRIVTTDTLTGKPELKGTLKISNMIPVPVDELTPYDIGSETDSNYKMIVEKEYNFIRKNSLQIIKNAEILYNQKTKEQELYPDSTKRPKYLDSTIQFCYAEGKCLEYCKLRQLPTAMQNEKTIQEGAKPSIQSRLEAAQKELAQRDAEEDSPARPSKGPKDRSR